MGGWVASVALAAAASSTACTGSCPASSQPPVPPRTRRVRLRLRQPWLVVCLGPAHGLWQVRLGPALRCHQRPPRCSFAEQMRDVLG
eukprot:scaffold52079_cov72-Phaeocystis_antarctica.AAC.3